MNTGYSGGIPDEVIEAVLQHNDIVDTVGKYVHLTKQGKYMKGLCPFHSEKTPSFTVTPERQIFYCYGCGAGGNAIKFRMEIDGLSFPEAVRLMAEESHVPFQDGKGAAATPQNKELERLLQAHEWAAKLFHYLLKNTEHGKSAMEYLRARGFGDKLIDQFQIGYAPDRWDTLVQFFEKRSFDLKEMEKGGLLSPRQNGSGYVDRFRGRVMFPIMNRSGRVIAFAGRILGEGQPKYLNSPESRLFNKSRTLYNLNLAKGPIRKQGQIVLMEGFGDVIAAWDAGVQHTVATMGTALTDNHASLIRTLTEEVVVCYDGDNAGQAAALKSIPILEGAGLHVKIAVLQNGLDPDEYIKTYGQERFVEQIIHGAVSTTKFRLIYIKKNYNLLEEDGKAAYAQEAINVIANLGSPTEREVYLKELSVEVGVSLDSLKQDCNLARQTLNRKQPQSGQQGGRGGGSGGNGRSSRKPTAPTLLPAYHVAERRLLSIMLQDGEAATYVAQHLGEAFNIPEHAALAAYIYSYYAQGKAPDVSRFIGSLHDDRLEKTATSISMMDAPLDETLRGMDDYIREIKKFPQQKLIEQKREDMLRAEKSGDFLRAAQIASEIITLERQ
ncbi:DNA primase [Paenibacillus wulumuqiensis]|uniref:DNA primase n=1 Tax=Paenibacillus wulumuqiensis TaxID=1567107 RepID=UPI000619C52D|nr:DNA primase [Paenibacillus wulumuqiensis]